jgi:hypothetical protein
VVEFIVVENDVGVPLRLDFRHEWMDVTNLTFGIRYVGPFNGTAESTIVFMGSLLARFKEG